MSNNSFEEDLVHTLVMIGLGAVTVVLMYYLTPYILLIGGAATFAYGWYHSPGRNERVAKRHTYRLYEKVLAVHKKVDLDGLIDEAMPARYPESLVQQLKPIVRAIMSEELASGDVPEPPAICNSVEGARYRDTLSKLASQSTDQIKIKEAVHIVMDSVRAIGDNFPDTEGDVYADISYAIPNKHRVVEEMILAFFNGEPNQPFKALRDRLDANFNANRQQMPSQYRRDDVVEAYLKGTPLEWLFELKIPFGIPEDLRFEHTHVVAGTGHGKTQTIQYLIAKDIPAILARQRSVVVIDSQQDLIRNLLRLDIPKEQVVYVNPEDIEHPFALNLFAIGQERFNSYTASQKEQLQSSIVELYEFLLASVMDTAMTGQQSIIFRYVTRLMLEIPGATLLTFLEILRGADYSQYYDQLDEITRDFFLKEFENDNQFKRMREAVARRLLLLLDNPAFRRMMTNPESKLDLFSEMLQGKLIIIDTNKAVLKEMGTRAFGRFFMALIAQAAAERAFLRPDERTPCMVYLDEAHEYIDRNATVILSQARKQKIGMVMAHQYLGQLHKDFRDALEAVTNTKLAGGVSASDARAMAGQMFCDAQTIQNVPKLTFVTWAKGVTRQGIPINFPIGDLERMPQRYDLDELIEYQRITYGVAPQIETQTSDTDPATPSTDEGRMPEAEPSEYSVGFKPKGNPDDRPVPPDEFND